jgi:hypothetical protein
MKYIRLNLHDKRFRSKASSASRLSPNRLVFSNMEGFTFLRSLHYNSVSQGRGVLGFVFFNVYFWVGKTLVLKEEHNDPPIHSLELTTKPFPVKAEGRVKRTARRILLTKVFNPIK